MKAGSNGSVRLQRTIGAALAVACLPGVARAQDGVAATQQPSPATSATEALQQDIVVTARKRGFEQAQKVPAAITAFGDAQIQALNVRDLKSLTATMPNVQLDGIGTAKGTANFTIRGLGINTSVPSIDPTVGVFVNGVYLGITSGVVMDDYDLEAIEVLRGPQGVLFGRNVTGGAVLIRTKRPTNELTGTFRAGVETGANVTTDAAISGPLAKDVLSARLAVYYSHDDGWFNNEFDDSHLGKSRFINIRPSILFTPNADVEVIARYEHGEGRGDGGVFQNEAIFPRGSFRTQSNEGGGFFRSRWNQVTGELNWKVPFGNGTITAIGGWREFRGRDKVDVDGTTMTTFNLDLLTDQNQRSAELRYAGTFGDFAVTVGGFYFNQHIFYLEGRTTRFNLAAPVAFRVGGGTSINESYAGFGSVDWHVTSTITLNAGARVNRETKKSNLSRVRAATDSLGGAPGNDLQGEGMIGGDLDAHTINISDPNINQKWNDVSPKVGFQWQPSDITNVYGYWAKGFRSGGLNIRHTGLGAPPTTFDSESQYAYELGWKQDLFDRKVRLNLALFRSKIKGIQRDSNIPDSVLGNVQIIKNAGNARVQGFEGEARLAVARGLLLSGQFGYTDGKYTKLTADLNGNGQIGEPADFALKLPRLAPWTYGGSVVYDLPLLAETNVSARVSYNHRDGSFYTVNNTTVLRSVEMVDASLALTPASRRWSVSVYGNNLLDRATWDSQSSFPNVPALGGNGTGGGIAFNALNRGRVIGVNARVNW